MIGQELCDAYYERARAYEVNSPEWASLEWVGSIVDLFGKDMKDVIDCIHDEIVLWSKKVENDAERRFYWLACVEVFKREVFLLEEEQNEEHTTICIAS